MIIECLIKTNGWRNPTSSRLRGVNRRDAVPVRSFSEGGRARHVPPLSTIIDLGAGTGTVIFAAAMQAYNDKQKLTSNIGNKAISALKQNYQPSRLFFVAIEINPFLFYYMSLRRFFHPNRNNIKIIRADIFKMDFKSMLHDSSFMIHATIYLYVGTPALIRLKPQLEKLPTGSRVVSYMYKVPNWERYLHKTHKGNMHTLYEYILTPQKTSQHAR